MHLYINRQLCLALALLFRDLIISAQNPEISHGLYKKYHMQEASWNTYIKLETVTLSKRSLVECGGVCKNWGSFTCVYFALENEVECQLGKEVTAANAGSIAIGMKAVYYLSQERPISATGDCYSPRIMHMMGHPTCNLNPTDTDFFNINPGCEDNSPFNYWLAPSGATGIDAHFVLDLGCRMNIQKVELKNTYNNENGERSTKDFTLELSDDPLYIHGDMSWTPMVTGTLNSIMSDICGSTNCLVLILCGSQPLCCDEIPTQEFLFGEIHTARYARFIANSYYGSGGAGLRQIVLS